MLSLSPITRSLLQNPHSSNGEHEVPVTPELGSPIAAVVARRRLSPASPAVVRRQRSASLTTVTNTAPTRHEPAAEGLPSPLENYSMKLSKYRGGATPSPLLREALSGDRKRKSSAAIGNPSSEFVQPGADKREEHMHHQIRRAKKPSLISPVSCTVPAKGRGSANLHVCRGDQVVPGNQTQADDDFSRRLPSAPQLGAKPLLLFGGDESDIFAT